MFCVCVIVCDSMREVYDNMREVYDSMREVYDSLQEHLMVYVRNNGGVCEFDSLTYVIILIVMPVFLFISETYAQSFLTCSFLLMSIKTSVVPAYS